MGRQADIEQVRSSYTEALRRGDATEAGNAVSRGLALGIPLQNMYLDILLSAQTAVGERWAAGEISIAEEHAATQITLSEMARLRSLIQPRQKVERSVLVTSIEGDTHTIGACVAADFLLMDGWDVLFLGADTPVKEIVQFAQLRHVDLVCISVTLEEFLPRAGQAVEQLYALARRPKVIIGGPRNVMHSLEAKKLQIDSVAWDAVQLVREARSVVGLAQAETALAVYLKALGARILEYRKSREMNQQDLADRSGLDRAYISSLENGKQNLTVGAVSKLAEALGISIEELLVGKH
jgi:MerR family transcriptional regulator, light-induced transcriptional regulator